jgi:hypothetical protein
VVVPFDQIERVQENAFVMVTVADTIERGDAIFITGDGFPIDDAGARGGGNHHQCSLACFCKRNRSWIGEMAAQRWTERPEKEKAPHPGGA